VFSTSWVSKPLGHKAFGAASSWVDNRLDLLASLSNERAKARDTEYDSVLTAFDVDPDGL